jgi:hypothetical protein
VPDLERGRHSDGRGELEADDGRDPRREIDRQRACITAFCPLDAMLADSHLAGYLADAQFSRCASIR